MTKWYTHKIWNNIGVVVYAGLALGYDAAFIYNVEYLGIKTYTTGLMLSISAVCTIILIFLVLESLMKQGVIIYKKKEVKN